MTEQSPPRPLGAGSRGGPCSRHRPRPMHTQWGASRGRRARASDQPPLPDPRLLPNHLMTFDYCPPSRGCRGLGAAAWWGGKKTEVPPPAGRVVTSPYRQPVAGVAAHHVIHAPPSPARARSLPPPARLPPLPPPLPNFRPPYSLTAVNSASSALPLHRRPHQRRPSGLPSSGPRSLSAGVPPSPTLSPNPDAQGAWASGVQWRQRQQFSTHSSHRGPGGLCRSAFKGDRDIRTASREPPPHPAARSVRQPCRASSPVGATRRSPPGAPHSLLSMHAGLHLFFFFFWL